MLDENLIGIFEKYILNHCFSNISFGNLKENLQEMTDEFYVKEMIQILLFIIIKLILLHF